MSTSEHDPQEVPPSTIAATPRKRSSLPLRTMLKILPLVLVLGVMLYVRLIKPVEVRTHRVSRAELRTEVFGRGTVESRREVQLGFDLAGRLSDIRVDEGDRVKLGQVLAHLSPEQYDADLRTASSGASLARAAIGRLEADERRAAATLTFAQSEEQRARALASTGSLSTRDLDLSVQQLALAKAEQSRVQAARDEAARNIDVASGSVQQRRAISMRTALVSPFDGLVIRRFRDPGDTVTVGATVLRVVATDKLWVRAWVDEASLGQLRDKQQAQVSFPGDGARFYVGQVDRIGREADRQTHELLVDIAMDTLPERIAIGQRADVRIDIARTPDVVQVPVGLLVRDKGATFCYVDRGSRIARADVELGKSSRDAVQVLSGLSEGDLVLSGLSSGAALSLGRRWRSVNP